MKIRKMQTNGYDNGVSLARAWQAEGRMLYYNGEANEAFYGLVDEESVRKLGDDAARQGLNLNLIEHWKKQAILGQNKEALQRLPAWNEKRLLDSVEGLHQEILARRFSEEKYPEIQGLAAYEDAEVRGIADTFGVDYRRVLLCKENYRRLMHLRITQECGNDVRKSGECTTVIFKDSPVGPIIGRNLDSGISAMPHLQKYGEPVLFQYPKEMGYSYIAQSLLINSEGLVISGSSIAYPKEPMPKDRYPVEIYSLVLRFCKNVTEALELMQRYNLFFGPYNMLVFDRTGDAAVIEKSKNTLAVRRTQEDWIFVTDGLAVEAKTRRIQGDNTPVYQFNLQRHQLIEKLLKKEAKKPSIEAMQRIMSNHTMPSPVCKHLDKMPSYYQLANLYSFILLPQKRLSYFRLMRPGPSYPCEEEGTKYSYWFN